MPVGQVTSERVVAFFLFSVAAAGTPGPSNALLTATGARVGVARGLPALLGVGAGMGAMMFLVAFGLGAVLIETPLVASVARWGGAAFLLWLAWKIATAGRPGAGDGRPIGFLGAAAFQALNPKSWLVCASAAATFLDQGAGNALGQSAALALTFVLAALPSCFPWLAFGAALQRVLRAGRAARVFNVGMGALLGASVILFVR
jgi:threonine/homoserine/homoserine lactone efflux protein